MTLGGVGVAGRDQALDDHDHFGDMGGRARFLVRRQRAEGGHVGMEVGGGAGGDGADRFAGFPSAGVDLVFHVRDVADVGDMLVSIQLPQQPGDDVIDDDRAGVADMREVVHRRSTDIHADIGRIGGFKPLLTAGQAVVQVKFGHRSIHKQAALCPRNLPPTQCDLTQAGSGR